jgi:hypothetical protein
MLKTTGAHIDGLPEARTTIAAALGHGPCTACRSQRILWTTTRGQTPGNRPRALLTVLSAHIFLLHGAAQVHPGLIIQNSCCSVRHNGVLVSAPSDIVAIAQTPSWTPSVEGIRVFA